MGATGARGGEGKEHRYALLCGDDEQKPRIKIAYLLTISGFRIAGRWRHRWKHSSTNKRTRRQYGKSASSVNKRLACTYMRNTLKNRRSSLFGLLKLCGVCLGKRELRLSVLSPTFRAGNPRRAKIGFMSRRGAK